jgi:preprotein translocase subunit YajC
MNKIWKTAIIAGLIITVLLLSVSCLGTTTSAGSANTTGTAEQQSTWDSLWPMLIFLVVIFAIFYFLMIRPQRRRQKEREEMMQSLHRGDKVITAGGIYGTIESVGEDNVVIKIESGATMRVNKASVALQRDDMTK